MSPAIEEAQQTTAATPRTAPMPANPVTPIETISRAATMRVDSVSPEIG